MLGHPKLFYVTPALHSTRVVLTFGAFMLGMSPLLNVLLLSWFFYLSSHAAQRPLQQPPLPPELWTPGTDQTRQQVFRDDLVPPIRRQRSVATQSQCAYRRGANPQFKPDFNFQGYVATHLH